MTLFPLARFVRSIYFRDPNGYVIELTGSTRKRGEIMDPAISKPHEALAHWAGCDAKRHVFEFVGCRRPPTASGAFRFFSGGDAG
jgi:hypothetical protein